MKNHSSYFILFVFLISPSFAFGQVEYDSLCIDSREANDDVELDLIIDCFWNDAFPEFPGGEDSLFAYLQRTIVYPDSAQVLKISGTVYISFVVEADGSISRVKLLRGIGGGCDEAALEAVRNMPKWKPEEGRGRSYAVAMIIPIKFSLK